MPRVTVPERWFRQSCHTSITQGLHAQDHSVHSLAASACFSDAGAQNPYVPGWVTIDLNFVDCVKATADDLLHFDGFGDEVYLVTFVSVANKSCATKYTTKFT